jgi:hypothetical protein
MAYTTIDKPTDYFNTKLYTGNGSSGTALTTGTFQPDFCWFKNRGTAENSVLINAINGASFNLSSNLNRAETDVSAKVSAFTSTGVTLGSNAETNENSQPLVAWNWKAGTSFTNDASGTGIGSIDSAGSVSTTSGFSIVKWTGTGATGTIAHGLGAVPRMIIVKSLANTTTWMCQHASIGNAKEIYLNNTSAAGNSTAWNSTTPTSTVFSVTGGAGDGVNASGDYIAYCFSNVKGFSKMGSYVGNGNADGPFIYTGFKPAWIMIKSATTAESWMLFDNKRLGFNPDNDYLLANAVDVEPADEEVLDIVSNGFKPRVTAGTLNTSGQTYIYMAFAEEPLVTSTGIPATAR